MNLFKFFKKKKKEDSFHKINFKDLESFLDNKLKDFEEKEKLLNEKLKIFLDNLLENLNNDFITLEKIDLSDRKIDKKIELIIKENLHYYKEHIKKLISEIEKIKENEKISFEDIQKIINNFLEKSNLNYEKVTFIIGKEAAKIREDIFIFLDKSKSLLKENEEWIKEKNIIKEIKEKISNLKKIENKSKELEEIFLKTEKQISNYKNQIKDIKETIELIKNSNSYKEEIKKEQEIEQKSFLIKKEFDSLKKSIDFKSLLNFYHKDEKNFDFLKKIQEEFEIILNNEEQNKFLELLSIYDKTIEENFKKNLNNLILKKIELENIKKNFIKKEFSRIKEKEEEIKKIESQISFLEEEKVKKQKYYKKIQEDIKNLIDSIKLKSLDLKIDVITI